MLGASYEFEPTFFGQAAPVRWSFSSWEPSKKRKQCPHTLHTTHTHTHTHTHTLRTHHRFPTGTALAPRHKRAFFKRTTLRHKLGSINSEILNLDTVESPRVRCLPLFCLCTRRVLERDPGRRKEEGRALKGVDRKPQKHGDVRPGCHPDVNELWPDHGYERAC